MTGWRTTGENRHNSMTARTARDEFPQLADFASRPSGWDSSLIQRRREASRALDRIDALEAELDRLRVGGVAERAVLDAAARLFDLAGGLGPKDWQAISHAEDQVIEAVRAWRGAAPTPGGRVGFGVDNGTELEPQSNPKETP